MCFKELSTKGKCIEIAYVMRLYFHEFEYKESFKVSIAIGGKEEKDLLICYRFQIERKYKLEFFSFMTNHFCCDMKQVET